MISESHTILPLDLNLMYNTWQPLFIKINVLLVAYGCNGLILESDFMTKSTSTHWILKSTEWIKYFFRRRHKKGRRIHKLWQKMSHLLTSETLKEVVGRSPWRVWTRPWFHLENTQQYSSVNSSYLQKIWDT